MPLAPIRVQNIFIGLWCNLKLKGDNLLFSMVLQLAKLSLIRKSFGCLYSMGSSLHEGPF